MWWGGGERRCWEGEGVILCNIVSVDKEDIGSISTCIISVELILFFPKKKTTTFIPNHSVSSDDICKMEYAVDSCYLEVQWTHLNTSRYPYHDMSDLQN